jgi:hypothetical protein
MEGTQAQAVQLRDLLKYRDLRDEDEEREFQELLREFRREKRR